MSTFPFQQAPNPWGQPAQPQYAAPAPQPQYAPQTFAPPMPQGFGMPSPYGQPYGPAPAQQHVPPGSLDAFMGQPKTGRPKAISWSGVPDSTTVVGYVVEDVTDRDIVPDTDPKTNLVKTWRDGSPKYVLVVTLSVQPSMLHPDGHASLYCRGDLWDKLSAAMAAAGRTGAPKAGDMLAATLVERRQGSGTVPKNIFTVQYATADGSTGSVKAAPTAPVQAAPAAPVQMPQPAPTQATVDFTALAAQQAAAAGVVPAQQYAAPMAAPAQASAPQVSPVAAPLPTMTPEQAALLAKIKGGQS